MTDKITVQINVKTRERLKKHQEFMTDLGLAYRRLPDLINAILQDWLDEVEGKKK